MVMAPLMIRFIAVPSAQPCARSRSGKISELYTHAIGPIPIENDATNASTDAMLTADRAVAPSAGAARPVITCSVDASVTSETTIPPALVRSSGLRPKRSRKNVATNMKSVLVAPTEMVAPSVFASDFIPAVSNTLVLYSTTESMPDACWKNWRPRQAISMRRTGGVG